MFTEAAEFNTSTGQRGTIPCCVFPIEDVDPFADTDTASTVKRIKIVIRRADWLSFADAPEIGNMVKTGDGKTWKIESSDMEQNWWSVKARSV